jgi:hypothetical protein
MRMLKTLFPIFPALSLALLLSGCADSETILCPSAAVLRDTATLTVFRAGAPVDPSGEAFTATIAGVTTSCHYNKGAIAIPTDMSFTVRAVRAPSADGANYQLPYYLAVTQGDRILSKKNFTLDVRFAPGSAVFTRTLALDTTTITLEEGHPATDYQLLVGFQLSEADRAYNQKRGRYTP